MPNITEQLEVVQFYTPSDPYYFEVDNRPLTNLANNINLLARNADDSAGRSARSEMAAASTALALCGVGEPARTTCGGYVGEYKLPGGLDIDIGYGFGTWFTTVSGSVDVQVPYIGVHDEARRVNVSVSPGTDGYVRRTEIWAIPTDATTSSRVPSGESEIREVDIITQVTPDYDATAGYIMSPPSTSAIHLMDIVVPERSVALSEDMITLRYMKTFEQTSNPLASAKADYVHHVVELTGSTPRDLVIPLAGSDINVNQIDACEVFLQGVNQFYWLYSPGANTITVTDKNGTPAQISSDVEVRVRQLTLSL